MIRLPLPPGLRPALFALCLGGALTFGSAAAQTFSGPPEVLKMRGSTFRIAMVIEDPDDDEEVITLNAGSGFAITPGVVMTNAHVIEDPAKEVGAQGLKLLGWLVVDQQGRQHNVVRHHTFKQIDLATLELNTTDLQPVSFFSGAPVDDQAIQALGYPGSAGQNTHIAQLSSGRVQGLQQMQSARFLSMNLMRHDATTHSGSSGGPLFNACGQLTGVAQSIFTDGGGPAAGALNFAIPSRDALAHLEREQPKLKLRIAGSCQPPGSGSNLAGWLPGGLAVLLLAALSTAAALWLWRSGGRSLWQKRRPGASARPTAARDDAATRLSGTGAARSVSFEGEVNGRPFRLVTPLAAGQNRITLGRSRSNDVVLDFEGISRRHATLELLGEKLIVTDLQSTNKTRIAGKILQPDTPAMLPPGALLRLGDLNLKVRLL